MKCGTQKTLGDLQSPSVKSRDYPQGIVPASERKEQSRDCSHSVHRKGGLPEGRPPRSLRDLLARERLGPGGADGVQLSETLDEALVGRVVEAVARPRPLGPVAAGVATGRGAQAELPGGVPPHDEVVQVDLRSRVRHGDEVRESESRGLRLDGHVLAEASDLEAHVALLLASEHRIGPPWSYTMSAGHRSPPEVETTGRGRTSSSLCAPLTS